MPLIIAIILTFLTLNFQHIANIVPKVPTLSDYLPTPTPPPQKIIVPKTNPDSSPWGVAKKIGEHTYQIQVQNDSQMGSAAEILQALNDLRTRSGAQLLASDPRLCQYAKDRADYFVTIKSTDAHAGFIDFLDNHDGFRFLGYGQVGENSSYGYVLSGVHLIEWVYNSDTEHSQNQLDPKWDRACVGVSSPATDLIFATSPL